MSSPESFCDSSGYDEIEETGKGLKPYMFEPLAAQKVDKKVKRVVNMSVDDSDRDNVRNEDTTYWCLCGCCTTGLAPENRFCCHEDKKIFERIHDGQKENSHDINCITLHPSFEAVCLNVDVLRVAYFQMRQNGEAEKNSEDKASNSQTLKREGQVARQALVLLLSTAIASSFLFAYDEDESEADLLGNGREKALSGGDGQYSRQARLMMAATNSRIGLRSALAGSHDTCHVDPVRMTIRPPPRYAHLCQPTTTISYGCRGGCPSYSRVDDRNGSNVLRHCSCCRDVGFGFQPVKMTCSGGFALLVHVKFARGCECRPCFASTSTVNMQKIRDLLRETSISIG